MTLYQALRELQIVLAVILGACPLPPPFIGIGDTPAVNGLK
jgi:hypothetical protein